RLKDLGVGLSLDDFGTGYSSLGNLRDFPVDTFKIDRSFITRLCHDKKTEDMVQLVLAMSRTLGKEVVAEGVENAGQVALLRSLGCRLVQGYHLSPPLSPQDMDAFIESGAPRFQTA
ncbi:MAG: EAL domain-containing protein, partial [Acidobacteriota bacterium]